MQFGSKKILLMKIARVKSGTDRHTENFWRKTYLIKTMN